MRGQNDIQRAYLSRIATLQLPQNSKMNGRLPGDVVRKHVYFDPRMRRQVRVGVRSFAALGASRPRAGRTGRRCSVEPPGAVSLGRKRAHAMPKTTISTVGCFYYYSGRGVQADRSPRRFPVSSWLRGPRGAGRRRALGDQLRGAGPAAARSTRPPPGGAGLSRRLVLVALVATTP